MNKPLTIAILFLLLGTIACDKLDYSLNSDNGPKIDDVIQFGELSPNEIVADSSSSLVINVSINKLADTAYSKIKIQSEKGHFINGTKEIIIEVNSNKEGTVSLYSGIETGPVDIRATVNSISINTAINFTKSLPDYIQTVPAVTTTTDQTLKLGLNLLRDNGRVGSNIKVDVSYLPLDTTGVLLDIQPILIVQDITDSIAISNPTNLKGRFEITTSTQNQSLETISSTSTVIFE